MTNGVFQIVLPERTQHPNKTCFRFCRVGCGEFFVNSGKLSGSDKSCRVALRIMLSETSSFAMSEQSQSEYNK
jgi:hypothetical protein